MEGIGYRLKSRAAELGMSGAEVARRAGLTPARYGHYVSDYREPDLATLVRICRVLALRPDLLLGYDLPAAEFDELESERRRLMELSEAMSKQSLDLAVAIMQAVLDTQKAEDGSVADQQSKLAAKRGQRRILRDD